MKVLIDSNVVLNVLLKEQEFYAGSRKVFDIAEAGKFEGFISASAVTDIFYVTKKKYGRTAAREAIKNDLLPVFKPATVTDTHIYQALDLDWIDFEDSVQYVVGESFAADYIVTRNTKDYSSGSIPAVTPEDFIAAITTDE